MRRLRPEAAFQQQVLDLAKLHGWRRAHFRTVCVRRKDGSVRYETPVQADGAGFPDLFLVRRRTGHRLVAELKIPPNKATPAQAAWLEDCEACGIPAFTWTQDSWDEIERVLENGP